MLFRSKRFSSVGHKMNDYSSNILALLVSWLTKTIAIPLFFLYAVIQLFKLVFRELFSGEFGTDTAEEYPAGKQLEVTAYS